MGKTSRPQRSKKQSDVTPPPPSKPLPIPKEFHAKHRGPIQPASVSLEEKNFVPRVASKEDVLDRMGRRAEEDITSDIPLESSFSPGNVISELAEQHYQSIRHKTKGAALDADDKNHAVSQDNAAKEANDSWRSFTGSAAEDYCAADKLSSSFKELKEDSSVDIDDAVTGLELDVAAIEKENAFVSSESYKVSESGTIHIDEFEIRRSGLARTPAGGFGIKRTTSTNTGWDNAQNTLVQLELLGKGASGVVYKALHVPTLTLVAQKTIPVYDDGKRHQMLHELRALYNNLVPLGWHSELGVSAADSPSLCPQIVSFYDAFINPHEGTISMIVEYMDGGSLQDIVDAGGCNVEEVLGSISYQVLKGLNFLHGRHQIHRDIKPANLLINHNGQVKISDFGIIRSLEDTMAQADTFVGTFTYMSPERIAGKGYSYTVDIWSLGLTIMTCALGHIPYLDRGGYWGLLQALKDEEPPRLSEDEFSPEFCDFTSQCLQKDPSMRPSAKELLRHPFLVGYSQDPTVREPDEGDGSDTAREELDELVDVTRSYYKNLWLHQEERGISPTIPNLNVVKLRGLSVQIGVSVSLVQRKLQLMVANLKRELAHVFKATHHSRK